MYQRERPAIVAYEVEWVNLREQVTAVISEKVGVEDPLRSFGALYGEICGHLARVGAQPIGPPFARYVSMNGALEVEVGFPIRRAVPTAGRMEILPTARRARSADDPCRSLRAFAGGARGARAMGE